MISCTEFIPAYNELFKYIEEIDSYEAVKAYWSSIADTSVRGSLGAQVKAHGVEGCWNYWSKSLTEEASDVHMEYDEKNEVFYSEMRHCPSMGHLLDYPHIEPYHDYCGHCHYLYRPILEELGISVWDDYSRISEARCAGRYWKEKK